MLVSDSVGVFEHLFADSTSSCVWNRAPDAEVEAYFQAIRGCPFELTERVRASNADIPRVLAKLPASSLAPALAEELAGLIGLFSTLANADSVGIRLLTTNGRPCPRFHSDRVELRMICTWVGSGTQWIEKGDLAAADEATARWSLDVPLRPDAEVHQMRPFAIGVFKGELWDEGRHVLHRSPPSQGADDWRAMISIDAL